MSEGTKRLSRRNFLLAVGAGAAGTAVVVTKNATPLQAAAGNDKPASRGYQASEHVNNYYRTTRI